jgi:hypothetical protein
MKSAVAVRACVLGVLAVIGPIASSSSARAEDVRILLIPARNAALQLKVWKLEQAIRDGHRQLAVAETLADAHVIIQFTDSYRSTVGKGVPLFHWVGQAKLLRQPEAMTISATPLPERFELLVIGEEGSESQRALKSLELMLSKTLRPRRPMVERDAT